ncbi:hypothetical protein [Treponema sp. OMZ 788]|uniref:hypothetical protein n=1 Tax=Treponema sp. OMZ 788 TaxID=2563664 RepID=UPI0020A557F7|nr:hypothetical protein [Treponema sp. OMZ 788]
MITVQKAKLSIYPQPNHLPRTAIAREQKQFIKIAFAVHLSAVISAERYRSDSGALKSAVLTLVYFYIIMIVHKCQQSAAQSCLGTFELRVLPFVKTSGTKLLNLLNLLTDRTFENRPIKKVRPCTFFISEFCIRKTLKAKTTAIRGGERVYVELILRSDAGDARRFKRA